MTTRDEKNRRRFPREKLRVKAKLSIRKDPKRQLEATLPTSDLSVGGLFFESTFFLRQGTAVDVDLELPEQKRPVSVTGKVVRLESNGKTRSGFAVQFTAYEGASEVALASFFLAPSLRAFVDQVASNYRISLGNTKLDQLSDLIAAWELYRSSSTDEPLWIPKFAKSTRNV